MRMFGVSEFPLLCQGDYGACVLVCGMLAVYGYELRVLTSSYLSIFFRKHNEKTLLFTLNKLNNQLPSATCTISFHLV